GAAELDGPLVLGLPDRGDAGGSGNCRCPRPRLLLVRAPARGARLRLASPRVGRPIDNPFLPPSVYTYTLGGRPWPCSRARSTRSCSNRCIAWRRASFLQPSGA